MVLKHLSVPTADGKYVDVFPSEDPDKPTITNNIPAEDVAGLLAAEAIAPVEED